MGQSVGGKGDDVTVIIYPADVEGGGTAEHYRSAEREDDGGSNVLRRGEYMRVQYCSHIFAK